MDVMANNLREINSLNQRGGRMLSVVDLIDDGTLDVGVAGLLLSFVSGGASFLTAAGPGGVGKSTLLAVLLSFLPPGERIRTVIDPATVPETDEPTCRLCHEIGSGHWFGYLWGSDAADFLALRRCGRIAATLHADTAEEIVTQLTGPGVGAEEEDVAQVDLLLTMVREGGMRRLSAVYETAGGDVAQFRRIVEWDRGADTFKTAPSGHLGRLQPAVPVEQATEFVDELVARNARHLEDVMAAVADFYAEVAD